MGDPIAEAAANGCEQNQKLRCRKQRQGYLKKDTRAAGKHQTAAGKT